MPQTQQVCVVAKANQIKYILLQNYGYGNGYGMDMVMDMAMDMGMGMAIQMDLEMAIQMGWEWLMIQMGENKRIQLIESFI